jgi:diaminohydroxyphosphoribosylaminopyrimidine deaminase/5-amino-6-(5-phosphoribosylamino)uracil reductase
MGGSPRRPGESRWITGPRARHWVHGQRACHDAVMVGAGTARSDDPMLTVRGFGDVPQPVRVVLSRRLDLPREGRWRARRGRFRSGWSTGRRRRRTARRRGGTGARLIEVASGAGGHLDVTEALAALGAAG